MKWVEGLALDRVPDEWLIGSWRSFTVGATAVQIADPSDKRVLITIFGGVVNNLFIGTESTVSTTNGIPISTNNNIIEMPIWRYGLIVQKPWWAVASAAGTVIGVIEALLP